MLWGTECADHFIAEHSQFCVTLNPTGTDMLSSAMEVATNGFQLCQYMFTKCVYVFVCCVYICCVHVYVCVFLCMYVYLYMNVCVFELTDIQEQKKIVIFNLILVLNSNFSS